MDGTESETTTVPAETPAAVPVVTPAVTPAATPPSRPMDTIHAELVAAKAAHVAAQASAKSATGVLGTLIAEYHAALTWFNQEEKSILSDLDDVKTSIGAWVVNELKKL